MEPLQGIYIVLIVIAVILAIFLIMAIVAAVKTANAISSVNNAVKNAGTKLQSLAPYKEGLPQLWEGVKGEFARLNPQGHTFLQGVEGHVKNFLNAGAAKIGGILP